MEQNSDPRNKPMQVQSNNIRQGIQEGSVGERIVSSVTCAGEPG